MHRDMQFENIFLKTNGSALVAMLADFGLARFCCNGCYSVVGTPEYRAPEIWFQKNATSNNNCYDGMVDLWSAVIIFFTMLAGELPFDNEFLQRQICEGDFGFQ